MYSPISREGALVQSIMGYRENGIMCVTKFQKIWQVLMKYSHYLRGGGGGSTSFWFRCLMQRTRMRALVRGFKELTFVFNSGSLWAEIWVKIRQHVELNILNYLIYFCGSCRSQSLYFCPNWESNHAAHDHLKNDRRSIKRGSLTLEIPVRTTSQGQCL